MEELAAKEEEEENKKPKEKDGQNGKGKKENMKGEEEVRVAGAVFQREAHSLVHEHFVAHL